MIETSVLRSIGQDLGGLGRWQEAAEVYSQSRRIAVEWGFPLAEAIGAYWQGVTYRELAQPADARHSLRYAVALFSQLRDPWGEAQASYQLALLAGAADEAEAADGRADGRAGTADGRAGTADGRADTADGEPDAVTLLRHALARCAEVHTAAAQALAEKITDALASRRG